MAISRLLVRNFLLSGCGSLLTFFVMMTLTTGTIYLNNEFATTSFYIFHLLAFAFCLVLSIILMIRSTPVHFTAVDLCCLFLLTWLTIFGVINNRALNKIEHIETLSAMAASYLFFRGIGKNSKSVYFGLQLFFIYQVLIFSSQLLSGWSSEEDLHLFCTGSFINPAMLATFVALIHPFGYKNVLGEKTSSRSLIVSIVSFTICFSIIVILQSRSSFLGLLSSLAAGVWFFFKTQLQLKKRYVAFVTAVALMIFAVMVYVKQGSINGRWLIYKITLSNLNHVPVAGKGFGQFRDIYPHWQAEYFEIHSNDQDKYTQYADNVGLAYNEFLNIFVEGGVVGLLALVTVYFFAFRVSARGERKLEEKLLKSSLIGLLVISIFSYPMQAAPILFVSIWILSRLSSADKTIVFSLNKHFATISRLFVASLSILLLVLTSIKIGTLSQWNKVREEVAAGDLDKVSDFAAFYTHLSGNAAFLSEYGNRLIDAGRLEQGISRLQEGISLLPDFDNLLVIADAYQKIGQTDSAIQTLRNASWLIPSRYIPKYRLMQLYAEKKDTAQALALATEIAAMPVKIPSSEITNIKAVARTFIIAHRDRRQQIKSVDD